MSGLWIKGLVALALVAGVLLVVSNYNKAVATAERLALENAALVASVAAAEAAAAEQARLRALAETLVGEQQAETRVVYETEIQTVEVVREVQGECLDVRVPGAILAGLRGTPNGDHNAR